MLIVHAFPQALNEHSLAFKKGNTTKVYNKTKVFAIHITCYILKASKMATISIIIFWDGFGGLYLAEDEFEFNQ